MSSNHFQQLIQESNMKNIRKGNDIVVTWSILRDGAPFSLEGKVVTIYLKTPFGKDKAERFRISNNQVIWTFLGKNQKSIGKYSLELIVNEGAEGMITTDYCNFVNLVSCSCMEGGEDEGSVQTESIELESNIYLSGTGEGGGGSYDDTEIRNELAELSAEIGKKQDTITDLETIRSGAAKGATALQSVPDTYATKIYVDNKIAEEIDNALTEEY